MKSIHMHPSIVLKKIKILLLILKVYKFIIKSIHMHPQKTIMEKTFMYFYIKHKINIFFIIKFLIVVVFCYCMEKTKTLGTYSCTLKNYYKKYIYFMYSTKHFSFSSI